MYFVFPRNFLNLPSWAEQVLFSIPMPLFTLSVVQRENVFCVCRKGLSDPCIVFRFSLTRPWKAHKICSQIPGTIYSWLCQLRLTLHITMETEGRCSCSLSCPVVSASLETWIGFVLLCFWERVEAEDKWIFTVCLFVLRMCHALYPEGWPQGRWTFVIKLLLWLLTEKSHRIRFGC